MYQSTVPYLVAEVGFEPHDLRVMSPTSYQAALLRDIEFFPLGAGDRGRTGTILSYHGILSPGRLPVPPHRRSSMAFSKDSYIIASVFSFVNPFFEKSKNSFRFFSDFSHTSTDACHICKFPALSSVALRIKLSPNMQSYPRLGYILSLSVVEISRSFCYNGVNGSGTSKTRSIFYDDRKKHC